MTSALRLGPVTFNDFEIPERLTLGGKQQLVIHSLPGGGRVVDAMGADDTPIRWSGVFSGQSASERIRLLDRLRRSGAVQLLSWDAWRYTVIVQEFQADITGSWWIPYRIEVCVLPANGLQQSDWLDAAVGPALTIGLVGAAALQSALSAAGARLGSSDVGTALTAAGDLAQYVTAQAYGAVSA